MNGMSLECKVKLVNSKAKFSCSSEGKEQITVDYIPPLGDGEGYTSLELLMLSLASCFGSTVKFVLAGSMDTDVRDLEIRASGKRREAHPTALEKINLDMVIRSGKLTDAVLENVIKTAEEKLCPVYSMLADSTEIKVSYRITRPETASFCGVFCRSCPLYIGTEEEPERLEMLSERMGKTTDELSCRGCRSDKVSYYCADCNLKKCAENRMLDTCSQCPDYPCSELRKFQSEMPHRAELWKSAELLGKSGFDKWEKELIADFSCSSCGAINSAYDLRCRKCGNSPGSSFTGRHSEIIMKHLGITE